MPLEINRHLDDQEIEQYSLGEVAEDDTARLEEHLLICESCQNRVVETDKYVLSMRSASARIRQDTAEKERRKSYFFRRWIPAVAALALIVVVAVLSFRDRGASTPPFAITLAATRGDVLSPRAPAGKPLKIGLELAGISRQNSLRVEVVDQLGTICWQGSVVPESAQAVVNVPPLASGLYFLRAYTSSGTLLREYGLEIAR